MGNCPRKVLGVESESWQVTMTLVNLVKHYVDPIIALPSSHFNTVVFLMNHHVSY